MITTTPQRILFFTNSEYGQSNVVLSVAHEFALRPNVAVHIASFSALSSRIEKLRGSAARSSNMIHFHLLVGVSMAEAWEIYGFGPRPYAGIFESFKILPPCVAPWSGGEYEETYRSCVSIIKKVEAHAIVVEPMASQAIDACRSLGLQFVTLSPNSPRDIVASIQPFGSIFRYPALGSGFSYPVPWYHIPKNLFLTCAVMFFVISSTKIRELDRHRQKLGLTDTVPVLNSYTAQGHYLCPATSKTEFPCTIPDNLTLCGPILPPASPVEEGDRELVAWLGRAPTILVNLGTHAYMNEMNVRQLAMALRILFDRERKVQVIWKLKAQSDVKASLRDILGADMDSGRVKVVDWLNIEPLALLKHDNLVCVVNHGGANSFFEAIHAGVPQIILPAWYDCYENAARIEWLGVGIHGNKNAASGIEAAEVGRALTRIVGDGDEAVRFRVVAKELGEDARRYSGRVVACDKILEFASR